MEKWSSCRWPGASVRARGLACLGMTTACEPRTGTCRRARSLASVSASATASAMPGSKGGSAWPVGHSRTSSRRCGPTLSAVSEDGMSSETLSEVVHTQEILVTSPAKKVRLDLRRAFSRQLRERMIQALRGQNRTGIGSPPRYADSAIERSQSRRASTAAGPALAVAPRAGLSMADFWT